MALRIPPRRRPTRVTLPEALHFICTEMFRPEREGPTPLIGEAAEIAAHARHEAVRREQAQLASDVAGVLLEAIEDGRLKVEGVPPLELAIWRSRIGLDWQAGWFTLDGPGVPFTLRQYYTPTVALEEAVALFEEPAEQTGEPHAEPERQLNTRRTTGPKPAVREGIKARILSALRAGRAITDADHDALTREFGEGASRTTCIAALREALSEFERETLTRTPTNTDGTPTHSDTKKIVT